MGQVAKILEERKKTHGDYSTHAVMAQNMKEVVRKSPNREKLTPAMMEGLDMILHKVARILNGEPTHVDHWDDIGGYAELVAQELRKQQEPKGRVVNVN